MPDKPKPESPIIIPEGTRNATEVMRGRDVMFLLRGKLDPEVVRVIAAIAENAHTNKLQLAELATMLDGMLNIVQQFADISANMKDKMQQIERGIRGELEGDEGAQSTSKN